MPFTLNGNVLITGGSGFLGRAILRQAQEEAWPCQFTVLARDEDKLYKFKHRFPDVRVIKGDVRDIDRLAAAIPGHQFVIHAAAQKFVPESESAVLECVANNIGGTRNVALACARGGVESAVFVSTDKACEPINLYGATKMVGEKIWTEANDWQTCRFTSTRYGNVIASTGSIIPVMKRQFAENGKVQVTDPAMTRFWMTAEEAVDCVVDAFRMTAPGAIVVPACRSASILVMAEIVAGEGNIVLIGPRRGEKTHETLVHRYELNRTYCDGESMLVLPTALSRAAMMVTADHEGAIVINHQATEPYSSDKAPVFPTEELVRAIDFAEKELAL